MNYSETDAQLRKFLSNGTILVCSHTKKTESLSNSVVESKNYFDSLIIPNERGNLLAVPYRGTNATQYPRVVVWQEKSESSLKGYKNTVIAKYDSFAISGMSETLFCKPFEVGSLRNPEGNNVDWKSEQPIFQNFLPPQSTNLSTGATLVAVGEVLNALAEKRQKAADSANNPLKTAGRLASVPVMVGLASIVFAGTEAAAVPTAGLSNLVGGPIAVALLSKASIAWNSSANAKFDEILKEEEELASLFKDVLGKIPSQNANDVYLAAAAFLELSSHSNLNDHHIGYFKFINLLKKSQ